MKEFKVVRWFYCILAVFIILCAGSISVYASAPKPADTVASSQNTLPENSLLQFSAGGHILGFKPDKVYFASFDHAIVEEFVGTKGVMPAANSTNSRRLSEENQEGQQRDKKGAPALGKVIYKDLWKGITLQYESRNGGIAESTYSLEPEAEVKSIKLKYNVAVDIQKDGTLKFRHPSEKGYFSLSAPRAWQDIEGKREKVDVAFADYGENTIGFRLGAYNRQYPVVIDPTYQWHTFYGSAGGIDYGYGIATDTNGNVYVIGYSTATWNGPGPTAPLNAYSGGNEIVVLKLNSAGAYQWHTFYGSAAGNDIARAIATDTSGNVYVTGYSTATWGAPLNAYSGGNEIVVLKLNSAGAYQWHTFYGSAAFGDIGWGIATDTSGNVYVTGSSDVSWNGPGPTAPLNTDGGGIALVVLKLNSAGAYQWHTFYGGNSTDIGEAIATDTSGNVYVTGYSSATWNGPGPTAPLNAHSGGNNIVALKLNSAGTYQWHTFYGSATGAIGYGIATDTSGNVYVTGHSAATWNGPGPTAPLNAYTGATYNIAVLKLNTNGVYQWHTFYGAAAATTNIGYGIATDTSGNVYVTGYSTATWGAPLNAYSGNNDIVVLKLNTSGVYQWHTFYGSAGAGADIGYGIVKDTSGNVYVTGYSTATWGAPLNAYSGSNDIVVLKLGADTLTVTPSAGAGGTISPSTPQTINYNATTTFTVTPNAGYTASVGGTCGGNLAGTTYTTNAITADCTVSATFTLNTYTVTATAAGNGTGTVASNTGGISYTYQTSNTGTTSALNHGTSVTLTATAGAGSTVSWTTCTGTAGGTTAVATCTFSSLDGNKTAQATFTLNTYTVTATATGTGTGTVASNTGGINYTYQTNNTGTTSALNHGTSVTLTATAGAGSTVSWTTCTGTAGGTTAVATCTFSSLDGNKTAQATFTLNTYTVTPSAGANGTINPNTPQTINHGSTTAFTVTPNAGYTASVGGTCGGTLAGTTYTTNAITANCTVTASFTLNTYTVTPSAGAGGTIAPNTPQTITHGSTTTFTVTPNAGYTASVGGTCGGTLAGTIYTTNAITANCTVSASFAAAAPACSYSISPASQSFDLSGGTGSVTVTATSGCSWTAASSASWASLTSGSSGSGNGTVGFTVSANSGASRTGTLTIADRTFTINQAGIEYTLVVTKSGTGTGSIYKLFVPGFVMFNQLLCGTDCQVAILKYDIGTQVNLYAEPQSGTTFVGWTGGGCSGTGGCTVTLNENTSVNAAFAPVSTQATDSATTTLETKGNDVYVKTPIIKYVNNTNSTTTYYTAEFVYLLTNDNKVWLKLTKADTLTDISLYSGSKLSQLYQVGSAWILHLTTIEYNGLSVWADLEYTPTNDGILWFEVTGSGEN